MKKAILVISFGTSHKETLEKNIEAIENDVKRAYPDYEVFRAFTSGMIIKKLKKENIYIDTVSEALEKLKNQNFGEVICLSTHILNGTEYNDTLEYINNFKNDFKELTLRKPLLTDTEDYIKLASIISEAYPPGDGRAYCLMGHGSVHFSDSAYAALDYHFKNIDREDIFVGTVEGFPDLDTLVRQVKKANFKNVVLMPLMVVAGDHAVNDMASDNEDSFKKAFEKEGFSVSCILKGLGEYEEVRKLYVSRI